MSFLGGAECSTGRNPLAQFTKHVSEDKSLQRDRMAAGRPMMGDAGLRTMGGDMAAADKQMMEDFYQAQQPGAQTPFAFEAMRRELADMHTNSSSPQPWAQEFGHQPHMNPDEMARMEAAFQTQGPGTAGFDANEFARFQSMRAEAERMGTPTLQQQQQQPGYYRQFSGYQAFNGGMPFAASQPAFMPQNQDLKGKGKLVELDNENWEAQFKQLESAELEQVDEAANKAIDDELNSTETMYGDFQAVWEGIQQEANERAKLETLDWANEFDTSQDWDPSQSMTKSMPHMGEYLFEPDNPYMQHSDPFSEGKRLVDTGGNLSLAALAFEAAVQQDPRHVNAWTELGSTQAMNEKETPAIRAYEAALRLDESHLPALMGLAVSYTNEGYDTTAYSTLERWVTTKYPSVAETAGPAPTSTHDRDALQERVSNLFIQAAMLSPEGQAMDADVQVGLGVLFYGNEAYDKAVDCFTAALNSSSTSTSPEHLLWNRLGATLANSGRSEEAINAYERALTINPNFVRARYNLGVSCINIGCFQEAAEHLLGALAMHKVAEEKAREEARGLGVEAERIVQNQSTNLFDTLRRVFGQMGRRDLADQVVNGMDLDVFRKEFEF